MVIVIKRDKLKSATVIPWSIMRKYFWNDDVGIGNHQSRSKFSISLENFNLDVSISPQKIGPRWVARSKISFSLEIFNLARNLEFFWSLGPLGTIAVHNGPATVIVEIMHLSRSVITLKVMVCCYAVWSASYAPKLSCTWLRVPPVALHVSRYTCRSWLLGFYSVLQV